VQHGPGRSGHEGSEQVTKNPFGRRRDVGKPYEIWQAGGGQYEWRVLKKYKPDDDSPDARWYCAVTTPHTRPGCDFGDVDPATVRPHARRIFVEPAIEVTEFRLPNERPDLVEATLPFLVKPEPGKKGILSPVLTGYFTETGMTLHRADLTGDVKFFLCTAVEDAKGVISSPWEVLLEHLAPGLMTLSLVVADDPAHPLKVPFVFDITQPAHRFDLVRFLQQHVASYYVLTLDRGELRPITMRSMFLDPDLRRKMALLLSAAMQGLER
jgi:hypothetical protein